MIPIWEVLYDQLQEKRTVRNWFMDGSAEFLGTNPTSQKTAEEEKVFPVGSGVSSAHGCTVCVKGEVVQDENIYDCSQWPFTLPFGQWPRR